MTVKEYANELNIDINTLLNMCKELDIDVKSENDFLSDDDIVMLDISLQDNESESNLSDELESKFEFEDRAEEILEGINLVKEEKSKKQKIKKKETLSEKDKEFLHQKKDIYKHKEKVNTKNLKIVS